MTLLTHAIVGASAGKIFGGNIWIGALAAFLSHFLIDIIPHGSYPLHLKETLTDRKNPENNFIAIDKNFFKDLIKMGADFFLGLIFAQLFWNGPSLQIDYEILLYALLGTLPDALQFLYYKLRIEPLTSLQKFHLFIHTKLHFDDNPKMAILIEATTSFASVLIAKFIV